MILASDDCGAPASGRRVTKARSFLAVAGFSARHERSGAAEPRFSRYVIGLLAIALAWLSERLKRAIGVPMALPLAARGNKTALPRRYLGPMNHSVEGNLS